MNKHPREFWIAINKFNDGTYDLYEMREIEFQYSPPAELIKVREVLPETKPEKILELINSNYKLLMDNQEMAREIDGFNEKSLICPSCGVEGYVKDIKVCSDAIRIDLDKRDSDIRLLEKEISTLTAKVNLYEDKIKFMGIEIMELNGNVKRYETALVFYADETHWYKKPRPNDLFSFFAREKLTRDRGRKARAALNQGEVLK